MLTCIDVKFIFDSVRLGLSSTANILQIADVALRVVFSVNGALTCRRLHFWRHFLIKQKILPNLVISNWLWWIMRVLSANQNWENILNE